MNETTNKSALPPLGASGRGRNTAASLSLRLCISGRAQWDLRCNFPKPGAWQPGYSGRNASRRRPCGAGIYKALLYENASFSISLQHLLRGCPGQSVLQRRYGIWPALDPAPTIMRPPTLPLWNVYKRILKRFWTPIPASDARTSPPIW